MEYTSQLLVEFLKKLIEFDIEYKSAVDKTEQDIVAREEEEENEWNNVIIRTNTQISDFLNNMNTLLNECKNEIASISSCDIDTKKQTYLRLQKCKQTLSLIESVEKSITNREEYDKIGKEHSSSITMSLDEVISANDQFINLAYEINNAIKDDIKKEITSKCAELYSMCRHAEQILNSEIVNLRSSIVENLDTIHNSFAEVSMEANKKIAIEWDTVFSNLDTMTKEFASQRVKSKNETCKVISSSENLCLNHIQTLIDNFCLQFPPEQFANEYARIHFLEPSFEHYKCAKEMPKNIYISTIEYDLTSLGLCDHTKEFLGKYYHFMYRNNKLLIPYCTQFNSEFNYIFEFDSVLKSKVAKDACDMGMRLFMMLPPGKVNFTW